MNIEFQFENKCCQFKGHEGVQGERGKEGAPGVPVSEYHYTSLNQC